MSKVTIEATENDEFFGVRYFLLREDGSKTHPGGRDWCEWQLASHPVKENEGGVYCVASREGKRKPWRLVAQIRGTCQASADAEAWLAGYTSDFHGGDQNVRVFHSDDWHAIQVRQHLNQVRK